MNMPTHKELKNELVVVYHRQPYEEVVEAVSYTHLTLPTIYSV